MTITLDRGQGETFTYPQLCREPSLEGVGVSQLSLDRLTPENHDLRGSIPGLSHYPAPVLRSDIVVDSDVTLAAAFRNLAKECPDTIIAKQQLLSVSFIGKDSRPHHGQVVVHEALVSDVSDLFAMVVQHRIPIHSVIPASRN